MKFKIMDLKEKLLADSQCNEDNIYENSEV